MFRDFTLKWATQLKTEEISNLQKYEIQRKQFRRQVYRMEFVGFSKKLISTHGISGRDFKFQMAILLKSNVIYKYTWGHYGKFNIGSSIQHFLLERSAKKSEISLHSRVFIEKCFKLWLKLYISVSSKRFSKTIDKNLLLNKERSLCTLNLNP